jgi:hypothetical protein
MTKRNRQNPTIAVIGGDGRPASWQALYDVVRLFPSARNGGNGSLRRALAAIRKGKIKRVVLWTRWLGHSDSRAIEAACKRVGVPLHRVRGGVSSMRALIAAFVRLRDCG